MVDSLLYDPVVRVLAGFGLIPLLVLVFTVGLVLVLEAMTRGRRDIEGFESFKLLRYESGNPMKGEARRKVSMQYFGYLILFLALEPAIVLLAIALAVSPQLLDRLIILYSMLLAVYTPLLIYGIRESRRAEAWTIE